MLACGRGAFLAKPANFKKIPEEIQINHEVDAKNNPKTIEKQIKKQSQKCCGKTLKISPKIRQVVRFWFPFWSLLHDCFQGWRVFVATCFSEPLGGYPFEPILASPGAHLVRRSLLVGRIQEQN